MRKAERGNIHICRPDGKVVDTKKMSAKYKTKSGEREGQ